MNKLKTEYLEILETFLYQKKKAIKEKILGNIRNLFENEEEVSYYKPVRVSNFWSDNCVEHEIKGDRNKKLSVEENFNKIRPHLKDIIYNLKKSDTWKIHLTIANNCISCIDNDEKRVMHSKSDNIEIMIDGEAEEVIKSFFEYL